MLVLKGCHLACLCFTSYKYVTWQICAQQITDSSVNLEVRVNQPIMKLKGKNIICVCMLVFTIVQYFSKLCVYNIALIKYTHYSLKNWIIVKNQHTNTDNFLTIKLHNRLIHSKFTNGATYDLLSINLLYYKLVKQR